MLTSYINEGSYGCVIKPGIKCKKNIKKNTVSKFFSNKKAWLYEINNNKIINKILKKENIVKLIDYCPKNKKEKILIQNCKLINTKKKYLYNIIYEYAGVDLPNHAIKKNIIFKDIFIKFGNILETVELLSHNNYIHSDIRLPNIVYGNNKLKLIDYGLMINVNDKKINKLKKIKYPLYYFPPEFNDLNLNELYLRIINLLKYDKIYKYEKKKKKRIKIILNYLFNNLKQKKYNNTVNIKTIDVYMIGIVMLELIVILNVKNKLNLSDKEYSLVFNYIKKLIQPNSNKRYNIKKAYSSYKKLVVSLKK